MFTFLLANKKAILIAIIVLAVSIYIGFLKMQISSLKVDIAELRVDLKEMTVERDKYKKDFEEVTEINKKNDEICNQRVVALQTQLKNINKIHAKEIQELKATYEICCNSTNVDYRPGTVIDEVSGSKLQSLVNSSIDDWNKNIRKDTDKDKKEVENKGDKK